MSSIGAGLVIPDLWQQEAVRALQQGKDVVVQAPTGSGKTYIFELLYPNLKTQAVFTVPTRAVTTGTGTEPEHHSVEQCATRIPDSSDREIHGS
jgi:replicative superfamily II helicase